MDKPIHSLRLIEDPVCAVTWLLKQLPLETCATYLALLLAHAAERGTLPPEEYSRLSALVDDILSNEIYRAA
jgi:hypothetical protein